MNFGQALVLILLGDVVVPLILAWLLIDDMEPSDVEGWAVPSKSND